MEKLDLNFQPKQVLSASSLNQMVEKTNELVDAVGDGSVKTYIQGDALVFEGGSVSVNDNTLIL